MGTPIRRIITSKTSFFNLADFISCVKSCSKIRSSCSSKKTAPQPALPSESCFLPTRDRSPLIDIYCHALAQTASAILAILLVKLQKLSEITILWYKKLLIIAKSMEKAVIFAIEVINS